ncbi:MAG: Fe-S cluster assembly protein SufD [Nitriliruptoraceae bacterium]
MNLHALTEENLTALSAASSEPDWLRDRRLEAYKRWTDQQWPDSRVDEFWRSTPFDQRFNIEREVIGADGTAVVSSQRTSSVIDNLDDEAAIARIVDGVVVEITLPSVLADAGVIVTTLAEAATSHRELVETHLGSLTTSSDVSTGANEDRTITASDAAWTAGIFVHIPAEYEVAVPISVHTHVTSAGAHLPRVLAVVEHHAKVQLYLEHTSEEGVDALVDEVVEVIALDSADVQVASLQSWADQIQHLSLQKIAAHRDSTVRTLAVTTGGATVRLRPEVDLVGPGARARPLGVYFADEGQWFDLQPYVRHLAPNATSDVLFKGALQGNSRTVFRGNIFVHRDAVGTATDENNRSLILTEGARADSTPFLEIECADITAGHGSATGQIDALHLFYLESRGIRRDDALRLIVTGFFREVLQEADLPGVTEASQAAIEARVESVDLDNVQVNDAALRDLATAAASAAGER